MQVPVSDFTERRNFPGTAGGPFDLIIRSGAAIERIPSMVFLVGLLLLARLPTSPDWRPTLGLWLIFLLDWTLLSWLPRARISFGPSKPQVLLLALLRVPFALLPNWWMWIAQAVGSLLVVYGFWIEPQWLEVTRQRLVSSKLRPDTRLRIVHIGDLHMNRFRSLDRRILSALRNLEPDLILFSGDVLNYSSLADPVAWDDARRFFTELKAELGVYAALGSPPVDLPEIVESIYEGTSVRLLVDEKITVEKDGNEVDILGVRCSHKPFIDAPKVDALVTQREDRFQILLYHSPDVAPEAANLGVDLQLSGHTHGGQVRLPLFGALYPSSLYGKRFEVGRRLIGKMILYVTRGIGLEGAGAPRVRFLCRPEVTLWELTGA